MGCQTGGKTRLKTRLAAFRGDVGAAVFVMTGLLSVSGSAFADSKANWGPPTGPKAMERWMGQHIKIYTTQFQTDVQKQWPNFRFAYMPFDSQTAEVPTATRPIKMDALGVAGAIASLHDTKTGQIISACRAPCVFQTVDKTDYLIGFTAPGHWPRVEWIGGDYPNGATVSTYMGEDMFAVARKASRCWSNHIVAGKPDQDAEPCMRFGPRVPERATRSGYCEVQFDILPTGWVDNVKAVSCTDPVFAEVSESTVGWWYYVPKTQRGQTVKTIGEITTMRFQLVDENGDVIGDAND